MGGRREKERERERERERELQMHMCANVLRQAPVLLSELEQKRWQLGGSPADCYPVIKVGFFCGMMHKDLQYYDSCSLGAVLELEWLLLDQWAIKFRGETITQSSAVSKFVRLNEFGRRIRRTV